MREVNIEDIIEVMNAERLKNGQPKMGQGEINILRTMVSNRNRVPRPINAESSQQIDNLRALGYGKIVDDGLSKRLSVGDIAINIVKQLPTNEDVDKQKAINLLVEAGKIISASSSEEHQETKENNISEEQQAVNLLVNAAKSFTGGTR